MTKDLILTELRQIFIPYTNNKAMLESITDQTDLINDLKINSANLIDIIIDVENRFGIEIDDNSLSMMTNVGQCIDLITKKIE